MCIHNSQYFKSLWWTIILRKLNGIHVHWISPLPVPAFSGMFEVMGRAFNGPVLPLLSVVCCCALMTGFWMVPGFTRLSLVVGPFLFRFSVSLLVILPAGLQLFGIPEVFSPKDFLLLVFKLLRDLAGGTIFVLTEVLLVVFEAELILVDRFSLDLLAPGGFSMEGLFSPVLPVKT